MSAMPHSSDRRDSSGRQVTVMDEDSSSQESRDVDGLAANRSFHCSIGKGEKERQREDGLGRVVPSRRVFAKARWAQVGRCGTDEREALVP